MEQMKTLKEKSEFSQSCLLKYEKMNKELHKKCEKGEFSETDLINYIIEARIQRDGYKKLFLEFKEANKSLADKIFKARDKIEKDLEILTLN